MRWQTLILKCLGWKIEGTFPVFKKMVIIAAPHTSIFDFINGWLALRHFGLKTKFIIKKEFFVFPLGIVLKVLGAVPVERGNPKNNMVDQMVKLFNENDEFYLVITPEGTRKPTKRWKKGFYLIANKANVPIVITKLDYGRKILGPVDVVDADMPYKEVLKRIVNAYKGVTGKKPDQFQLPYYEE